MIGTDKIVVIYSPPSQMTLHPSFHQTLCMRSDKRVMKVLIEMLQLWRWERLSIAYDKFRINFRKKNKS